LCEVRLWRCGFFTLSTGEPSARSRVIFIAALLNERDRRVLIPEPYIEHRTARANGKGPISQLPGQVERLSHRLCLRQAQCVLFDLSFDARAYLRGGPEEPIRGR
jgi:hypothetical protein